MSEKIIYIGKKQHVQLMYQILVNSPLMSMGCSYSIQPAKIIGKVEKSEYIPEFSD